MSGRSTFTMIKPDAVAAGNAGLILDGIIKAGFKIKAFKYLCITQEQAQAFYAVHEGKPFFSGLINFMSSGPIYASILEKEDAVEAYRAFIGKTNPAEAAEGTIRKLFGSSIQCNAVHGSDSDESAENESNFFFSRFERF